MQFHNLKCLSNRIVILVFLNERKYNIAAALYKYNNIRTAKKKNIYTILLLFFIRIIILNTAI